MLEPNDLPLVCLPIGLNGEAAENLIAFLEQLADALGRHYQSELRQYRAQQRELDFRAEHCDSDPF